MFGVVDDVCVTRTTDFVSRSKVHHLLPAFAELLHRMIVVVFAAQLINSITVSPVIRRNKLSHETSMTEHRRESWGLGGHGVCMKYYYIL